MPYTKEMLLNNSHMSRMRAAQGGCVKGVLSIQEQNTLDELVEYLNQNH